MVRNSSERITREKRAYDVLQLKMTGATDRQIAETMGISAATVNRDVKGALGAIADGMNEGGAVDRYRALITARYEDALLRLEPGRRKMDFEAWRMWERIIDRLATIWGIKQALTGLPGSSPDSPLWVSIAELADRMKEADPEWEEIRPGMEIRVNGSADD